jgi:riboflavin biosynthesis pyrimidine reductase
VDELELFQGPHRLGPGAPALAAVQDRDGIPDPPRWRVVWVRRAGRDVRIRLQPQKD